MAEQEPTRDPAEADVPIVCGMFSQSAFESARPAHDVWQPPTSGPPAASTGTNLVDRVQARLRALGVASAAASRARSRSPPRAREATATLADPILTFGSDEHIPPAQPSPAGGRGETEDDGLTDSQLIAIIQDVETRWSQPATAEPTGGQAAPTSGATGADAEHRPGANEAAPSDAEHRWSAPLPGWPAATVAGPPPWVLAALGQGNETGMVLQMLPPAVQATVLGLPGDLPRVVLMAVLLLPVFWYNPADTLQEMLPGVLTALASSGCYRMRLSLEQASSRGPTAGPPPPP